MVMFQSQFCVKITNCAAQFPCFHPRTPLEVFPTFVREVLSLYSRGIEARLSRRSKVALLSSSAVVWYSSGRVEPAASPLWWQQKVVLMRRDRRGNAESPRLSLYELVLKNKVNKTGDAEPRISISCLRRGDGARVREERAENGDGLDASGRVMALLGEAANCCFQLRWGQSSRQKIFPKS